MEYYIVYDIEQMNIKDMKADPYTFEDVQYHKKDIAGYDGVTNVRISYRDIIVPNQCNVCTGEK